MTTGRSDDRTGPIPAGKRAWKYRELDHADGTPGRELIFTDVAFSPLGYSELRDAKLHRPMDIPLVGSGIITTSGIGGIEAGQHGEFRTTLESFFTSKSIGLVKGGWLPSVIALEDGSIMLPDRCVVAELNARLKGGITKPKSEGDFIDLFADSAIRINPMLFVLEGDGRHDPSPETLEQHLNEAVSKIRSALPKAILVGTDALGLKGMRGLIETAQARTPRMQEFLLELSPKLAAPVGKADRQARWEEVLDAAQVRGIPHSSLTVVAALSAILVQNGNSPARRLLKFRHNYTRQLAYNALADLRSLEMLMLIFGLFPDQRVMLCTADKDMALFWAGLRASNFVVNGGQLTYNLAPTDLMPGITDEQWNMFIGS